MLLIYDFNIKTMPNYTKTLDESISVISSFKQRAVVLFHEVTINIAATQELIKGIYRSEAIALTASFSNSSLKVLNEVIKIIDDNINRPLKSLTETITLVATNIRSMARTFIETIKLIATNPKEQFKIISEALTITGEFSKNWYRECSEIVSIIPTLLFGATKLTFSEVIKIVQFFNARLDMKVLYETIKMNALISFKKSALGCNEIISIADSFIRNMTRSIVETITIIATGIKNFPILFEERLSIFESQWSILNGLVSLVCAERIILGISTFQYQGLVMFKEIITIADDLTVRVEKTFNEIITVVGEYEDMFGLALRETINVVSNTIKTFSRIFEETITLFSGIARSIIMELEYIIVNDEITRVMSKIMTEIITIVSSLTKNMFRVFSETITLVDEVYKRLSRTLSDAIALVDSKGILSFKVLLETLKLTPWISNLLNGKIVTGLWARVERNFGTWRREDKDWK